MKEDYKTDLLFIQEALDKVLDDLATHKAEEFVHNILDKISEKVEKFIEKVVKGNGRFIKRIQI